MFPMATENSSTFAKHITITIIIDPAMNDVLAQPYSGGTTLITNLTTPSCDMYVR